MNRHGPDAAYRILAALVEARTGQHIDPSRYWRTESLLRPVSEKYGLADLDELVAAVVKDGDERLATDTVEALLNNETSFFRNQNAFQQLVGPVLSELRERRSEDRVINIWSAGCSTGQEPYSLALSLCENAPAWQGWRIRIVATDISGKALSQARAGRYSQWEIQRGLGARQMLAHFRQDGDDWVAGPELKRPVSFVRHDLAKDAPLSRHFDLILCRNVLLYFRQEMRAHILDTLCSALRSDGFLMLGASETVIGQTDCFVPSREFAGFYRSKELYRKDEAAAARSA